MFVIRTSIIHVKPNLCMFNPIRNFTHLSGFDHLISANACKRFNSTFSNIRHQSFSAFTEVKNLTNTKCGEIFGGQLRCVQTKVAVKAPLIASAQSSKKRTVRRKSLDEDEKAKYNRVFAFATADEYDMVLLKEEFANNTLYKPSDVDNFKHMNMLHVKTTPANGDSKEMYIFEEGSVVFWNIPKEECFTVLKFIKQYELGSYSETIVQNEQEMMPYCYAEEGEQSDLVNGLITLSPNKEEVQSALDKYTFSNAMALSVKLGVWECILECYIADVELLTEDLKLGRKIRISSKEVLRKTGELFSLRHAVNLSSDALDVPDFYWDLETQEKVYIKMCNYFSINRRTTVVNEKISHCLELLDLLASQLNDKHHVRLEWMIIILITVEVVIAIIHSV